MQKTVKPVEATTGPAQAKLLTAEHMMEMLGVSRTGLYLLMRQEGLPYIKFGATPGAPPCASMPESVEQWLARNERHAAS